MKFKPTTITKKGQVTIPVEVRQHLRLKNGDQVRFVITSGKEVKVSPAKRFSILSLYGSLKPQTKPKISGQKLIKWESDMAHQKWAQKANK